MIGGRGEFWNETISEPAWQQRIPDSYDIIANSKKLLIRLNEACC